MDYSKIAIEKHAEWKGKLSVETKAPITNREELSIAYTPGVAAPCLEIQKNEDLAYTYTGKGNLVAVITDGTAVLGLGDIGPAAGMPVMEGSVLCSRHLPVSTLSLSASTARTRMRSSAQYSSSPRVLAVSTWRISAHLAVLRSREG